MGTSLSGLTPATTFDGLLKVGDNDPLTSTLKAISTGDGTDTMLELSTTALQIGGATGMYWDNTNKRLGLNDVTPTSKIDIKNTFGASALSQLDRMGLFVGYTSASFGIALGGTSSYTSGLIQGTNNIGNISGTLSLNPFGSDVGVGSVSPTAKLHIKGSGATSATTSLLVQNSAGTDLFKVEDGGDIQITGFTFQSNIIKPNVNGFIGINHNSNRNFSVIDSNGARTYLKVQSSSTSNFADVSINTDHLVVKKEGQVGIGETTPSARLHVKGAGNDATTTALLVQNSGGNDALKVTDDRKIAFDGEAVFNTPPIASSIKVARLRSQTGTNSIWIQNNTANIGLSESNPTARLHVKGSGNDATTNSLLVENSDGTTMFRIKDSGYVDINPTNSSGGSLQVRGDGIDHLIFANANDNYVGIGGTQSSSSVRAYIKGKGATSATTSLLVQNSAGGSVFSIRDDGALLFHRVSNSAELLKIEDAGSAPRFVQGGNVGKSFTLGNDSILSAFSSIQFKTYDGSAYSEAMRITGNTDQRVGIGENTPTARLHIKGAGNDNTTTSLLVQNSDGDDMFSVRDDGKVNADNDFYVQGAIYGGSNTKLRVGTDLNIASTRAWIQGLGATSATTALLVENSSGTDLFKVTDDGAIDFGVLGLEFSNDGSGGTMSIAGDRYIKLASALSTYSALGGHIFKTFTGSAYSEVMRITGNTDQFVGIGEDTPSAKLHVKGSGTGTGTESFLVQNSIGNNNLRVRDDGAVFLTNNRYTFNAAGGAVFKGSGATSATTALLVENSAGTDTLEVRDDGRVVTGKGATTNANGTFNVLHGVSNLTTRVFTVSRDSVLRGMDINSGGATKISDSSGDQSFSHTATAVLEVSSTNKGFLPPRMTGTQRDAIESPASGLIIYNTTTNKAQCYNGTDWNDMF